MPHFCGKYLQREVMETMVVPSKKSKVKKPHNSDELILLLQSRNIDTQRYEPIGAGFYHQYEDCFDASVICIDRVKFAAGEPYIIKIILEDFTNEEYAAFRKKFEVIINPDYRNYYNLNIGAVVMQSQMNEISQIGA